MVDAPLPAVPNAVSLTLKGDVVRVQIVCAGVPGDWIEFEYVQLDALIAELKHLRRKMDG